MKNYLDEKTGLSVTTHKDGSFEISAPPAGPTMLPTTVFTGKAREDASAEDQIEAFLSKYGKEEEPPEPEPVKTPKPVAKKTKKGKA